ncbi:TIR domain-containing protein [Nocardioides sp. WV_118_6]
MAQRTFISFDYDNDARLKDLLVGQAKHPDSPFQIADWSIKEASSDWKDRARRRIKAAGLVVVLCGKNTSTATGVSVELEIAKEEGVPYFLLAGYQEGVTTPTSASSGDKLYEWTWDNLKLLVGGAR